MTSYYLIGGATLLLLAFGLIMVLSASSIPSLRDGDSITSGFQNQALYALVALPVAFAITRIPVRWIRRLAWPAMLGALGLQLLLFTPLAVGKGGNSAWVQLAPGAVFQPSEFGKFGLALWLGAVLATKGRLLRHWSHVLFPAVVVATIFLGTVVYSKDLGTAMIMIALVAGALWVAGVPISKFVVAGSIVLAAVAAFVVSSDNRTSRILSFLNMGGHESLSDQPLRAIQGLGTGGISGVGLGASREKWLWLPAAEDDFIFAIIGEELGLLGCLLVLALFVVLAIGFSRVITRHPDPFVKITTAAIACWILGQALVNIGVVIGVLPVIGVPLPLLSKGGSALVTTLGALAVVLAFARDEPCAKEALAARRGSMRRSLSVIAPGSGRARG
ncbi:FtsW/RodA/SpoVE family cell cycle protein [Ruania halotolerans]|uniref:FtsW/RodA/SpoVE family cell cycle protein n=1 Tax=Ruania halotolerans TaxID=2897773 RepID=UPI001E4A440E|nr:FtsW/RodA/SpoVE family cell cycle protein [Ruania halotolerans]UFU05122.1 FtsW/RodA/SpoVE family cell cycle protein [Ruania halotolerans]